LVAVILKNYTTNLGGISMTPVAPIASKDGPLVDASLEAWRIIGRFDDYFRNANTKAASFVALNSLLAAFSTGSTDASTGIRFLSGLVILSATTALFFSMRSLSPYLHTSSFPESLIFFGEVAKAKDEYAYYKRLTTQTQANHLIDLAAQAYVLAKGLDKKHRELGRATIATGIGLAFLLLQYGLAIVLPVFLG
jgi:hypothetical protein